MKETKNEASLVSDISIVGQTRGQVRQLESFDKKRHTVPDRVCGATQGFLEKLCATELAEEAEAVFQRAREQFDYKRKEISLETEGGWARLSTKDFQLELRYFLDEEDPTSYLVESSLGSIASRDLLESEAFNAAVGSRFDRLRYRLAGGVSVESVIDAVEADESGETRVEYPSNCEHCTVVIEGVPAEVYVDGSVLELRCERLSTAGGLLSAFERVGERFLATVGLEGLLR